MSAKIWPFCGLNGLRYICPFWKSRDHLIYHLRPRLIYGNTFALLALGEANQPVTDGFLSQRSLMQALIFHLMCTWTNGWANSPDTGDLRHHCAHCDVIVMYNVCALAVLYLHWHHGQQNQSKTQQIPNFVLISLDALYILYLHFIAFLCVLQPTLCFVALSGMTDATLTNEMPGVCSGGLHPN